MYEKWLKTKIWHNSIKFAQWEKNTTLLETKIKAQHSYFIALPSEGGKSGFPGGGYFTAPNTSSCGNFQSGFSQVGFYRPKPQMDVRIFQRMEFSVGMFFFTTGIFCDLAGIYMAGGGF